MQDSKKIRLAKAKRLVFPLQNSLNDLFFSVFTAIFLPPFRLEYSCPDNIKSHNNDSSSPPFDFGCKKHRGRKAVTTTKSCLPAQS